MGRVGVIGTMCWDTIIGPGGAAPFESWGGIAFALAGLNAGLDPSWHLVPVIKVGDDQYDEAMGFLRRLERADGEHFVRVPEPNNRVTLQYHTESKRTATQSGGVLPWQWNELEPVVDGLDALYVNFLSGEEMSLETFELLRKNFDGPIYTDLHSLFLGERPDGSRELRPLVNIERWLACTDAVQMNDDEMVQCVETPEEMASLSESVGVALTLVTMGPEGSWHSVGPSARLRGSGGLMKGLVETQRCAKVVDTTGCGDVFGSTVAARLFCGDPAEVAIRHGHRRASATAGYQGMAEFPEFLLGV